MLTQEETRRRDVAILEKLGVTPEKVIQELASIAFARPDDPAISGDDKVAALALLARIDLPYREDNQDSDITRDSVLEELTRLATYDIRNVGETRETTE